MSEYIPSPRQLVREQVELYEKSGGKEGTTLRDTGLPVIIVTHRGNKTGAIRKTPLAREGRRPLRAGRLDGRRADQPGVGVQPTHESRRRDS
jgi:F420H(2)-dependent quinone reductase